MKKYNVQNYIRYKEDLKTSMPEQKCYDEYTRHEMVLKFMPLVENIARKFSTSQQASGVMSINDLIQEGGYALQKAVDRLEWKTLEESDDIEKTLKSFFSKRVKGAIRRHIDMYRGDIRIPEHKINDIRNNFSKDHKMVAMFFNSIFLSIDEKQNDEEGSYDVEDKSEPYNKELLNMYLKSLLKKHLDNKEYEVLRLSYGLDCDKVPAKDIAIKIGIKGDSGYVRVSQLKKQAVQKLIDNVDHSQVIDYL
jgi:RNA polymerase sigma factor (sigma-70 family)